MVRSDFIWKDNWSRWEVERGFCNSGRLLQERLIVVTRRSASVSFLLYFNIFYLIFNFQELTLILSVSFFFSYCPASSSLLSPIPFRLLLLPLPLILLSYPFCPFLFHPLCCASLLLSPSESCSSYVSVISYQWGHELWNVLLFITLFSSVPTFSVSFKLLLPAFVLGVFFFCLVLFFLFPFDVHSSL